MAGCAPSYVRSSVNLLGILLDRSVYHGNEPSRNIITNLDGKECDGCDMNLTNESFVILISTKTFTEFYYRDKSGWLKVTPRGRRFRATAEQVLNHVLPALAGIKPNVTIRVEHCEDPETRILVGPHRV
jgi:hypothetical protein